MNQNDLWFEEQPSPNLRERIEKSAFREIDNRTLEKRRGFLGDFSFGWPTLSLGAGLAAAVTAWLVIGRKNELENTTSPVANVDSVENSGQMLDVMSDASDLLVDLDSGSTDIDLVADLEMFEDFDTILDLDEEELKKEELSS